MDRRRFLTGMAGILASGFAPAVVGSGVLMPVRAIWKPNGELTYDGLLTLIEAAHDHIKRITGIPNEVMWRERSRASRKTFEEVLMRTLYGPPN